MCSFALTYILKQGWWIHIQLMFIGIPCYCALTCNRTKCRIVGWHRWCRCVWEACSANPPPRNRNRAAGWRCLWSGSPSPSQTCSGLQISKEIQDVTEGIRSAPCRWVRRGARDDGRSMRSPAALPVLRPARTRNSASDKPGTRFCACLTRCQVQSGATPTEGGRDGGRRRESAGALGSKVVDSIWWWLLTWGFFDMNRSSHREETVAGGGGGAAQDSYQRLQLNPRSHSNYAFIWQRTVSTHTEGVSLGDSITIQVITIVIAKQSFFTVIISAKLKLKFQLVTEVVSRHRNTQYVSTHRADEDTYMHLLFIISILWNSSKLCKSCNQSW